MKRPLCLLVDDEPDILELLVMTLNPMDIECCTAENLTHAKELLQEQAFDLCLTDMRLPDGSGMELITLIQQNYPNTLVAVITAHGNVESAVQALKAGAFDYITKTFTVSELRNLVRNLVNTALRLTEQREEKISSLVGESEAMQILRTKITKLARGQAPVYIKGESGTGKEVVARMIHALGARADKPFIPVNCGAIPTELMESEFFGHKKGSFTGASADKQGLFQAAHGGTLFLDEVADLPLSMQVKLLRAIQEKQIRSVGAQKEVPVDVRILSATHRDLAELVKQSRFRQDLFYRINVIELYVPPLRERSEDIPLLVEHLLGRLNAKATSGYYPPCLSTEAIMMLKKYSFPGNVRELENILERAITLCEDNVIQPEDLQLPTTSREINSSITERGLAPLDPLLNEVEKETIQNALEQTKGNKTRAAKLLGITLSALRYRLQKLNLVEHDPN